MSDWQNVSPLEAHQAWEAGTHEIQQKYVRASSNEPWCDATDGSFGPATNWAYRIREKARTITVTIPRPEQGLAGPSSFGWHDVILKYKTEQLTQEASNAIRAAMEQQP